MFTSMLKSYPMLSRFVLLLLLAVIALGLSLQRYRGNSSDDTLVIESAEGLSAAVEIRYDANGVATINSQSRNDAYFATGFLHASDRLTQLALQRRLVKGQMSELLGRGHLNSDIWMRTLGLYKQAQKALEYMSPETVAALQAYSAGINHYLSQDKSPSVEYDLLGLKPAPWQPADSVAIQKLLALNLGMNFNRELENVVADSVLQRSAELDSAAVSLLERKYQLEQTARIGGKGVGSNAWVIAGRHTVSGKPMLANDPHLNMSIPSIWYAISQKGGELDVSGMTVVGMPMVVMGANRDIAWGGTNLLADVQDLVLEQPHANNPNLYAHQGQWQAFETSEEVIHIRADMPSALQKPIKPVKIIVRRSANGPVISDIQNPLDAPMALRWTALADRDNSIEALMKLNLADDWQSFNQALSDYKAPTLNFLYSDKNDNIGYVAAGAIPLRDGYQGRVPVAGWLEQNQWQGVIAPSDMPREFNPESGFIVNANDEVTAKGGQFISDDWVDPARAQRIEQLLVQRIKQGQKIDLQYISKMQLDTLDINGKAFAQMMKGIQSDDEQLSQLLPQLSQWSGEMSEDSVAPVIYVLWLKNIKNQLLNDDLRVSWRGQSPLKDQFLGSYINNLEFKQIQSWLAANDPVCDKRNTEQLESCDHIVEAALQQAMADLDKLTGDDWDDWRWNEVSKVLVPHAVFSQSSVLRDIYNREYHDFGTYDTVNVSGYVFDRYEGFTKSFGATFRQVIELDDDIKVYSINSTGQSENVLSNHYDDMLEAFTEGRLLPLKTAAADAGMAINRR